MVEKVISLEHIDVSFDQAGATVQAVKDVSLEVEKGDIYGVVGYSGAGKSTLVRVINLLQMPTAGKVVVNGEVFFEKAKDGQAKQIGATELRTKRRNIGMIFQHFNLLEEKTVIRNVEFALKHSKKKPAEVTAQAERLLKLVGLEDRKDFYPAQLSGGQQQRVAIARALANDPEILISDEATSALDPNSTVQILDLLKKLNSELNLTIVLITHQMEAVKQIADKIAVMSEGEVIERGDLVDVFTHPKQQLTKELIGTDGELNKAIHLLDRDAIQNVNHEEWELAHLTYTGRVVVEPIAAKLYKDFSVEVSIIFGNVDELRETPVGTLFVTLKGSTADRQAAVKYLRDSGVDVEEFNSREVIG
ncbi:ABC transporter, ATP-binding protein [Secundilactobacillus odoratitofui DSM 19909 = JCM 15043]|uniref:ABC transporter, ATP-binding protein n=1 Tax=Secundilactobacillus odoratitofui DSM 19909 = JCM 15043 TaxID=1423776 RepID=A0A0R1LSR8_9LACO|nr:methionine ABC transporter ATP-binding protein [Secundilactobacillus odoratitofui]KRK98790.1 ABC transporter, ATP-binding protein [Secundilactobacillus odoratitofui DSM 19909 = JCM 15043]